MKNFGPSVMFMTIGLVLGLTPGIASQAAAKPLKVFILAGQSNMQGHVNVSTFDSMADDPKTAPILKEMRDADGKPHVCRNIWISSIGCAGDDMTEQKGKVTVPTASYWDDELEALQERMDACWPKVDARVVAEKNTSWENKMKVMAENFKPDEWKRLRAGASNGGYHYLGAAKIMAPIGKAFAEAMVSFQKRQPHEKP